MKQEEKNSTFNWKSFIPLFVVIVLVITAYFLGLFDTFTFENIKAQRDRILLFVSTHPFLSPLLYILIYMVVTALSIPGATVLTLIGGFVFPFPISALYVVTAATLGADAIFLAAKTSIGNYFRHKFAKPLRKLHQGFQQDALSYLFFLRFVPLFPFWLVNIAFSLFNVRLWTFTWTTFIGIIPGSLVFTYAASSINTIFDERSSFSIDQIFTTKVIIALSALGVFALLPIFLKRLIKRFKK